MERTLQGDRFDWRGCEAVQFDPLKLSGRATVGSSRMDADGILINHMSGMAAQEIAETFEVDLQKVEAILAFARVKDLKEVA